MIQMNLFTKQEQTDREHTYGGRGKIWGEGIVREFWMGMGMCTLLCFKWITNKDLLHKGLCSKLCGSLDGGRVWRRVDTCTCRTDPSLST